MPRPDPTHDILAAPQPGFFLMRLVKKGWNKVPARIIYENRLWRAEINGELDGPAVDDPLKSTSVMRIWETGRIVPEPEYRHAIDLKAWALRKDPTHPAANPRRPIDLTEMKPVWSE